MHKYMHKHIHACLYTYTNTQTYTYMHKYIHKHIYIHVSTQTYICIYMIRILCRGGSRAPPPRHRCGSDRNRNRAIHFTIYQIRQPINTGTALTNRCNQSRTPRFTHSDNVQELLPPPLRSDRTMHRDIPQFDETINQSINQPTNQPTNQSTNQPNNQPLNQSLNQPINQPTNQSTNQPIN